MANPTLTDLITRVRLNARDNSSVPANQSLTDADITGWINIGMRMVQRRYAPRMVGQTGAQTGLSYAQDVFSGLTTAANYAVIHELFVVSGGGTTFGVPLAWKDVGEFMSLRGGQSSSADPSDAGTLGAGLPVNWTAWREATTIAANQGKWRVLIHPPSGSTTVCGALVELEQADLSAGGDSPDVPAEGCTLIECIASYFAAHNLGRVWADTFLDAYPELKAEVEWKTREESRHQGPRAKARA